jgi:hypothetical protein
MHYELHGSSGTPLLLPNGGLLDIRQKFGEPLPGNSQNDPPTTEEAA